MPLNRRHCVLPLEQVRWIAAKLGYFDSADGSHPSVQRDQIIKWLVDSSHELLDVQKLATESLEADVSEHQMSRGQRATGAAMDDGAGGCSVDAHVAQHFKRVKGAIARIKKLKKAEVCALASKWCIDDATLPSLLLSSLPTIRSVLLDKIEGMDIAMVEKDLS